MRTLAVLLAAALATAPAHAQSPPQPPPPGEVVDTFHEGLRQGNRRKALEQMTADVVVFEQGRIDRSRTAYARRHLAEDIGFATVTQRTVSRRTVKIHGTVAWVTSVNRTHGTFKSRAVDFTTDETMILVHAGGRWRIAHIHWSFDDQALH